MASKTEGIALLSMYNDEDGDEEEEEQQPGQIDAITDQIEKEPPEEIPSNNSISPPPLPPTDSNPEKSPQDLSSPSPILSDEPADFKTPRSPTPPPFRPPRSNRSSPAVAEPAVDQMARRGALAMVDYEHDDADMSPEAEEGEIMFSGRVMFGSDGLAIDGNVEERTPPGTVQILTPTTQSEPPQPSDLAEQSKSETNMEIDSTGIDPEVALAEVAAVVSEEVQNDDPLKSFLPPLMTKCPEELQEKINKFLAYKRAGKSFNADLRNRKDYRNPDFLQHAVRYQDIDQIGTCFSKDVFDPHGYDKSDYYDEIEADMKREMERKEQERKKAPKLDFVPGGTQPNTAASTLKINTQVAGGSASVTTGLQSVPAVDAISRDVRQNKKTKWDKIDGDTKNPLNSGGHDNFPAVGVHAVHLSAANAGTGYTAFAQQKRKEAEERRSGERKFDKRSS
ncbi:SAP30-binding protein isoform X1 [Iris pallida]|uniref:SAP30-binding protein isoform X1 n=1 Tax=Iris pallida TaxID=29817 RepID=A0AAX6IDI9_IRIPA|nr:SAP30-binding protein isoform X1 [Iris pallida]KAJ6850917.1 SAP30-binding protein isoform X1 [Iris pallida]